MDRSYLTGAFPSRKFCIIPSQLRDNSLSHLAFPRTRQRSDPVFNLSVYSAYPATPKWALKEPSPKKLLLAGVYGLSVELQPR